MQDAWNHGDFRGYMQGFKNPDVIFVSGGKFQDGWQGTLDHYIRDYGASPDTRGTLRFYDISIEMLGPDAAQLISRYQLVKQQHPQYGINTRLMRKVNGQWVIALNHVSSSETAPAESQGEPLALRESTPAPGRRAALKEDVSQRLEHSVRMIAEPVAIQWLQHLGSHHPLHSQSPIAAISASRAFSMQSCREVVSR